MNIKDFSVANLLVPFPIALDTQALEILRRQIVMRKEQKATAAFTNKSVSPFSFKEWLEKLYSRTKLYLWLLENELRVKHAKVSHEIIFFSFLRSSSSPPPCFARHWKTR